MRGNTHHLISSSAVHETILVAENSQPERGHCLAALSLRKLSEVAQEDLAELRVLVVTESAETTETVARSSAGEEDRGQARGRGRVSWSW